MYFRDAKFPLVFCAAALFVLWPAQPTLAQPKTTWTKRATGGKPQLYLSANGRVLVVETDENSPSGSTIQVWNTRTAHLQATLKRLPASKANLADVLQLMAVSDDGARLFVRRLFDNKTGIYQSRLEFWNVSGVPELRATRVEKPENMALDAIATSNGWKLLFDHSVETLDASGKTVSSTLFRGLASDSSSSWGGFARDGSRIALSDGPQVLDATGRRIAQFPVHGGLNMGFRFSPDCRFITVYHRDIMHSPSRVRDEFELWLSSPLLRMSVPIAGLTPLWSPDGRSVLGSDGRFRVARTGKVALFQPHWPRNQSLRFDSAQMTRDGKIVAVADGAGNVWFGRTNQ